MPSAGVRTNDSALIELVAGNHMLATRALVESAGLSRDQWGRLIRSDIWLPVAPGQWRHAATPLTWEMKVRAGSAWLGHDAALYGPTATRWWGLEGCNSDEVGFLVPRSQRHLPPWMSLHTTFEFDRRDILSHRGVRTSSATRAIIDMARSARPRALEAAIDSAVSMRYTSVPTLTKRMRQLEGRGRNGIRVLRTLLLDSGGESFLERAFLRLMREAGLPRPRTQVVHRRTDDRVMRVDFQFTGTPMIVEVSGRRGHASDRDRQRDARRRNSLGTQGWVVLEFTAADVIDDPAYVITTVGTELSPRHRSRRPHAVGA